MMNTYASSDDSNDSDYKPSNLMKAWNAKNKRRKRKPRFARKRKSKRSSKPDPFANVSNKHEPFNFIVGKDEIDKAYNQTLSNLQPLPPQNRMGQLKNDECKHKGRVFAVGIMKTGTTSMTKALELLGYHCSDNSCIHLGNWFHFIDTVHLWMPPEVIVLSILNMTDLLKQYQRESNMALAFGDSPWCFLYRAMDIFYPKSKFILMTRKDDETYINSYLRYLKKYKKNHVNKGLSDNEFALIALRRYHIHNQMVREYFKNRPDDLLEIQVGVNKDDEWKEIIDFLGCPKPKKKFPHENKSNKKKMNRKQIFTPVKIEGDEWDWRKQYGDKIPYLTRGENEEHTLHLVKREDFVFDWNLFLIDDLRVEHPLSNVTVDIT